MYNEFQTFADQHVALFQNRRNGKVNDGEKKTYPNALATISPSILDIFFLCTSILFLYQIHRQRCASFLSFKCKVCM